MSIKREHSPADEYSNALHKRIRHLEMRSNPVSLRCMHCCSLEHTWSRCEGLCMQCWNVHARKRCPNLTFDNYIPGGFALANDDVLLSCESCQATDTPARSVKIEDARGSDARHLEGVAPERQAMIALTPVPEVTPSSGARWVEGGGQQQTKANLIPLGRRRQAPHPAEAIRGHQSTVQSEGIDKYQRKWIGLKTHVSNIVHSAESQCSPVNNGQDRVEIDEVIEIALELLKPTILR